MYAITGITGKVGGTVGRALLAAGQSVRAVVRDAEKGKVWAAEGCEVDLAAMDDADALTVAFRGADGVFILLPPVFDPAPGFPEANAVIAAVRKALEAATPRKVVCLSTIGAQADQPSLLTQLSMLEADLRTLPIPVAFLRPAWFMENFAWDVASARENGVITSFLQPLDRPFPMVATADVGRVAADLLRQVWSGTRVVELEGDHRVTPDEAAATFARVLGRPVRAEVVARETWGNLFLAQGMKHPVPRIQMLDGFNEGWIAFELPQAGVTKGAVALETVIRDLAAPGR